jgi:membrane protein DedA with SNARE-associated domain
MPETLLGAVSFFILLIIEKTGYLGIFLLMALESANIPIPSEIIMPFSGFLVSFGPPAGGFSFWPVVLFGALGNLAGSLFSYWLGYLARNKIFYCGREERVSAEVERAKKWTEKFGDWAVFFSRLLPIVRTFISFPMGVLKVKSLWRFSAFTFAGSFVWSAFLVWLGLKLGDNWESLEIYFRKFDYAILDLIIIGGVWWGWRHFRKNKVKSNQ